MDNITIYKDFDYEKNKNKLLWRYMDIGKFINLISEKKIYFSTPDQLEDIDKYDSSLSTYNEVYLKSISELITPSTERSNNNNDVLNFLKKIRPIIGMSCWHQNSRESYSFWQSYSNNGIAICTTLDSLVQSLPKTKKFIIGKIKYNKGNLSSSVPDMFQESILYHFFNKRQYYSSEKEIRILTSIYDDSADLKRIHDIKFQDILYNYELYKDIKFCTGDKNQKYDINIDLLINKIYIAPKAPNYIHDAVLALVKIYGINGNKVQKSNIFNDDNY